MTGIKRDKGLEDRSCACHSKILLLSFVFFIFTSIVLPSVSSQATQWTNYDVHHAIRIDGAPSSSIFANITVADPDGIIIVNAAPMQYSSTTLEHNYTLTGTQLSKSGSIPYQYTITATGLGYNQTETFELYVSPSGQTGMLGFMFIALIASYGLLFISVYIDDTILGMLATFMLFFLGFYLLFNGIDIYKNTFTDVFSVVTLGFALYSTAKIAEAHLNLWN